MVSPIDILLDRNIGYALGTRSSVLKIAVISAFKNEIANPIYFKIEPNIDWGTVYCEYNNSTTKDVPKIYVDRNTKFQCRAEAREGYLLDYWSLGNNAFTDDSQPRKIKNDTITFSSLSGLRANIVFKEILPYAPLLYLLIFSLSAISLHGLRWLINVKKRNFHNLQLKK